MSYGETSALINVSGGGQCTTQCAYYPFPFYSPVYVLLAPVQDHRIQRTQQFQQPFAGIGMQGRERVSNGIGLDYATIKHGRFGSS